MRYQDYLKKNQSCPFCHLEKGEIFKQNRFAWLILAKAPYTRDHLLVVPRRHAIKLSKLSREEKDGFEKLIYYGMKLLHKKYPNVSIIYREGRKDQVGKSINHMHYHLIPNLRIGAVDINLNHRKIMDEDEYVKKTRAFKNRFL